MNRNPWTLPLFLGAAMGAIYFLPSAGEVAQAAVDMKLPGSAGEWTMRTIPPSKEELEILAKDTEFAKAICITPRPGGMNEDGYLVPDRADLSIVLSGYDLNNSIHRPERCMPAQGHVITSTKDVLLKLPNGREFTVRRLLSNQRVATSADKKSHADYQCVTYYFFVGHDRLTHDHLERTLIDMKDRLVRGMDQRWAYVSASMWYGKVPWIEKEVSEGEADEKLRTFLMELAEKQIKWGQIAP